MQLASLTKQSVQQIGREFYKNYHGQGKSFEYAAQCIVENLFNMFHTPDDEPEFALLRIFRTMSYDNLLPELQAIAKPKDSSYLTLMGSVGLENAWCDRRLSTSRRAIHISENMSPMFKGIFREFGFSWEDTTGDDVVQGEAVGNLNIARLFHVEDVSQSTYITDQQTFVEPYQIKSVVASGITFYSGAAYVLIGFTRIPLTAADARTFANISPFVSTVLAGYDARDELWTS